MLTYLDNVKGRGLNPNDSESLQTFEIFIPVEIRKKYNDVSFKISSQSNVNQRLQTILITNEID